MLKHDHDYDCNVHYLQPITPVEFCPFCGKELNKNKKLKLLRDDIGCCICEKAGSEYDGWFWADGAGDRIERS